MKKIYWASIFLFCVVTHLFSKSVMYACPWPDPEFSVLSLKPVNMLRVTERPYQKVHGHKKKSLDVPFSVIDHSDGKYVYLKNESSTGAVIDHMDSKKRPMRYKYRYLYVGRYGLLAPASDGKPMKFETEVRYVQDIDPITQKEGTFVVGYDCKQKKSLYEKHFLVPTHTFKEPILDDIPFSFEKPSQLELE